MNAKLMFIGLIVFVTLCSPAYAAIIEDDWAHEMLNSVSLPAMESDYHISPPRDNPSSIYSKLENTVAVPHDCCLINDPYERHEAGYIAIIRKGTPLTVLGQHWDCLYVECNVNGEIVTGFIPSEDYRFPEWKDEFAKAGYYTGRDVDLQALYRKQYAEYKRNSVASGYGYTVAVCSDGTCVAKGKKDQGQCDVYDWENIIAVSASHDHTVGLKADGTVVAVGNNNYGQCNVENWGGIVAISTGYSHTVGLTAEGKVVIAGDNTMFQHDLDAWRDEDIVEISADGYYTAALTSDGRVLNAGWTYSDSYDYFLPWDDSQNFHGITLDTSNWRNIVSISAGASHLVGLKADGTVVGDGESCNGELDSLNEWPNTAMAAAALMGTYGVAEGGEYLVSHYSYESDESDEWKDVRFMDASATLVVGVRSDGTVISAPSEYRYSWDDVPSYDLSDWRDIGLSPDSEVFVDFVDEDTVQYINGVY